MPKDSQVRRDRLSRSTWPSVIFIMVVIFAFASYTFAHRVVLFAYVKGNRIFTESYFNDGKKCQNSRIEVFDTFDNKLLEGKTDKDGEFSFKPPKMTDLKIVLTASMGHKDEYVIPAGELQGETEGRTWKTEHGQVGKKLSQRDETPAGQLSRFETQQIRMVVEEALEEKLKPIMRLLSKPQKEGVSFIQVMGGIGFIFGIMGIILYFRSRRGR